MKEINVKDLKGKTLVIVEYSKIYPPEYYEKRRGRKSAVTSYKLDKDNIVKATKVVVEQAFTSRDSIDMDSKKMTTKIHYRDNNGNTGNLKLEEHPTFTEIFPDVYVYSPLLRLSDQIENLLNG